jgi:polyphosphate kinase 2
MSGTGPSNPHSTQSAVTAPGPDKPNGSGPLADLNQKKSEAGAGSVDDSQSASTAPKIAEIRHDKASIIRLFETGEYPYKSHISTKDYEEHKAELQVELLKVQDWVKATSQKIVILFEGRDAAGKGGTIRRFMEHLNPRGARVVALEKPTERERTLWYFQRYIQHLPAGGEIVLFDRSWYNRAGVERVMGFCTPNDYLEFMRQTPDIERMLVNTGTLLFKYWFSVSDDEQERRFQERITHRVKRWKISPMDLEARKRWIDYSKAKDNMFRFTEDRKSVV